MKRAKKAEKTVKVKLLCIADTHGSLDEGDMAETDFDLCIMLGDHSPHDAGVVLKFVPKEKIFALDGNHDYPIWGSNYIDRFGLKRLNHATINGVTILGMGGSAKFRENQYMGWTQEEAKEYLRMQPRADILITHDGRFKPEMDEAHRGLEAIDEYIEKWNCLHLHGHRHKREQTGNSRCIYGVELVEFD